ncbi:MAG TPA: BlaI/MecI/CopY family transcriptional regulator [Pyrinomonadaceae bacterium]|nr:BlaI/MecI/CopY family transcriptional regulator [Pyrinomonadaceae bacterium]
MPKRETPRPTDAELEILKVLWRRGPATVREVFDALSERRGTGYTTVLKLMQIMAEKGLVTRDETERAHRYAAAQGEGETQSRLVGDLVRKAFDGSARNLVLHALSAERASEEELSEIRQMLDELERRRR